MSDPSDPVEEQRLPRIVDSEIDALQMTTLEKLPIGAYRSTPDGRMVDANPALVALLGYPDRASLLSTSAWDLYADPAEREHILKQADRDGTLRGVETQVRNWEGGKIWVRLNTFLARDARGLPLFYVGTIEDVTERRLAEEALWDSEARQKLLLDQLPAMLWTTDRELRITLAQGTGLGSLNLLPNELTGTTLFEYFQTDDADFPPLAAHRRALGGEAVSYATEWAGRAYESHVRPLQGSDGKVAGTLGIALDVTERWRAQEALREGQESYRALYERELAGREQAERLRAATAALGSTLDLRQVLAVILRELQGVVPYDSASIQEMRGDYMEVIAGHGFPDLERVLGTRFDVRATDNPNREVFLTHRTGVLRDAPASFHGFEPGVLAMQPGRSWIGVPLLFGERMIGMLSLDKLEPDFYTPEHMQVAESFAAPAAVAMENARLYAAAREELAERRRIEEQLRHSQKMEAVGRLAGGIAHDFNNLLGVILGYTGLALRGLGEADPIHSKLKQVQLAADRASSLTRQLLAFGRKQVLLPEVLDLAEVLAETCTMLRRLIGEDVEIVAAPGGHLGLVLADRGQIAQAILNLALNARDAMPGGGTLTLDARDAEVLAEEASSCPGLYAGRYVALVVSDTGTGIDGDVLPRIFEPFFTTKEPGKGTGLGLSMVYGFVKQSGGYIDVDSESGRGTTFRLLLPRLPPDTARPARVAHGAAAPSGGPVAASETILLVEDEDGLRDMIAETLREAGYQVLEASTAARALTISGENPAPIHLLLTDVVMPGQTGTRLAERLRELRPTTRVLFMSGYIDDGTARGTVLADESAFIQKPFRSEDLLGEIRRVLSRT